MIPIGKEGIEQPVYRNTVCKGFNWVFRNGKHELSIAFHEISYGHEVGLFEALCSWKKNTMDDGYDDGIRGNLSFREVAELIDELNSLEQCGDLVEYVKKHKGRCKFKGYVFLYM